MGILTLFLGSCASPHQWPVSDHFDGQKFFNPGRPMHKSFGSLLKWRMTSDRQFWPEYSLIPTYDRPPKRVEGNQLRVSWIGHATVLIQTQGLNILTDPVWAERASPVAWAGPRRVHPPGIAFKDLPPIDVVLVSHNHYDHLDLSTLARLWQHSRPRIIVPLGNEELLAGLDPPVVAEAYDWGEKVAMSDELAVHLDPMHHWSARGIFDRNKALWAAFTITTPGGNIYFVGDSGYGNGDYFRAAKDKYKQFRLAILPIGDYDPRWFMAYGHMAPEECLQAFEDLGRPVVLPIHYGTFPLADTGYNQPLVDLRRAMAGKEAAKERVISMSMGESRMIP
ncbi:MAG: MBL fold metallo-hydrolase [Proteobacteria bacterium]|nr:MBL fold metallo-hydrolase [Pseudomonadota bacterium]